jgi:hypothetical protein
LSTAIFKLAICHLQVGEAKSGEWWCTANSKVAENVSSSGSLMKMLCGKTSCFQMSPHSGRILEGWSCASDRGAPILSLTCGVACYRCWAPTLVIFEHQPNQAARRLYEVVRSSLRLVLLFDYELQSKWWGGCAGYEESAHGFCLPLFKWLRLPVHNLKLHVCSVRSSSWRGTFSNDSVCC